MRLENASSACLFGVMPCLSPDQKEKANTQPQLHCCSSDLARQYSPETIYDNLRRCWDLALSHGSKVLVLTVPEVGVRSRADEMRDKLNDMIRKAQGGSMYVHVHIPPFWFL